MPLGSAFGSKCGGLPSARLCCNLALDFAGHGVESRWCLYAAETEVEQVSLGSKRLFRQAGCGVCVAPRLRMTITAPCASVRPMNEEDEGALEFLRLAESEIGRALTNQLQSLLQLSFPGYPDRAYYKLPPHLRLLAIVGGNVVAQLGVELRVIRVGQSVFRTFGVVDLCVKGDYPRPTCRIENLHPFTIRYDLSLARRQQAAKPVSTISGQAQVAP